MEFLATLQKKWEQYNIADEEFLVIGVSGGVDSMVLLHLVTQIHPVDKIIVTHIDHNLREKSQEDSFFVKQTCQKYGIIFEEEVVNIQEIAKQKKMSVEMAGRIIRYDFFEKIRIQYQAKYILTAHHLDDSIETLLINFIRGARLRGLSGMETLQGKLFRPLLDFEKSDIYLYAKKHNIPYHEDITNTDTSYVRNRVRQEILPQMEKINPKVRNTLSDFSKYAHELNQMMENILTGHLEKNYISEHDFKQLPNLLQLSFIEKVYSAIHGGTIGLSKGNLEELQRFILEARGGTIKELGKLRLEKRNRKIIWSSSI